MENDDDDDYLRKRKRINYDESDPQINMAEFSDDNDALLLLSNDYPKKTSKNKEVVDDEQWEPSSSPPDVSEYLVPKKKKRFRRRDRDQPRIEIDEFGNQRVYSPKFFTDQVGLTKFANSLAYVNKRNIDDPDLQIDPSGDPCPFIPYEKLFKKMSKPSSLFRRSTGFNTLMPEYDSVSKDKMQYFNLESAISLFDYEYIRSMRTSEILKLLKENKQELKRLKHMKKNSNPVVIPFDDQLTRSISIKANILYFDWAKLGETIQFDVVLMDPPWPVTNDKMTRGVEISYEMMPEADIASMPIHLIQKNGYLFMWVVAKEFAVGLEMMNLWGYELVGHVNWVKVSRKGKYHPSNGYYIMHTKETLIIGVKGEGVPLVRKEKFNDLIVQPRNVRQSHKPDALYKIIEEMFPGGKFFEVFARPHNLRDDWISIGNELPG